MPIYRLCSYSADKVDVIGLYRKWDSINLVYRILGGLAIGVVLALIVPGSPYIALLGSAFIWALKAVAPFLVLFLVINTLAKSGQNLGPRFRMMCLRNEKAMSSITVPIIYIRTIDNTGLLK